MHLAVRILSFFTIALILIFIFVFFTDLIQFVIRPSSFNPAFLSQVIDLNPRIFPPALLSSFPVPFTQHEIDELHNNSFVLVMPPGPARRTIIATAATHHYIPFLHNLHCSVRRTTGLPLLLLALDPVIANYARLYSIPVVTIPPHDVDHDSPNIAQPLPFRYGTQPFARVSKHKLAAVRHVMASGFDIIFSDVDIVWCASVPTQLQNFLRALRLNGHGDTDILMQNGMVSPDDPLIEANTGFYYAKATRNVLRLFDSLVEVSRRPDMHSMDDQMLFNDVVCRSWAAISNGASLRVGLPLSQQRVETDASEKATTPVWVKTALLQPPVLKCFWDDAAVKVVLLPLSAFPNGARVPDGRPVDDTLPPGVVGRLCTRRQIALWHVNYCVGEEKEVRLRRQGVWTAMPNGTCPDMPYKATMSV